MTQGLRNVRCSTVLSPGHSDHHTKASYCLRYMGPNEQHPFTKTVLYLSPSIMCLAKWQSIICILCCSFFGKSFLFFFLKAQPALTCHVRQLWENSPRLIQMFFLLHAPMTTRVHLCPLKCHIESFANVLVISRNGRFPKGRKPFSLISLSTKGRERI